MQGRGLVQRHHRQPGELAGSIAKGGDVHRDGEQNAIFAAQLRVEAGHLAGRKSANAVQIGRHSARGCRLRRPLDAAKPFHLRDQARSLAGSQNLHRAPLVHQIGGMVAQQALRGGVHVGQPAIQPNGRYHGAGRVEQFLQRLAGRLARGFRGNPILDQQTNSEEHGGTHGGKDQQPIEPRPGCQACRHRSCVKGHSQSHQGRPDWGEAASGHWRGLLCSGHRHLVGPVLHGSPRAVAQYIGPCTVALDLSHWRPFPFEKNGLACSQSNEDPFKAICR